MDTDVVVVGGGPSGLATAAELALQGARVVVLERRTGPVQSRAGTILPRVLELFDSRGYADRFIDRARAIRSNPFLLFHIWAGMQPVHWRNTESAFPFRLILPQHITEDELNRIALGSGVEVLSGHTVTGLEQDAAGVTVFSDVEGGETKQISARYVVGADGGRSAVRKFAGIGFPGHDGSFTGIIADLPVNMNWPQGRAMTDNEFGWGASFPFGEDGTSTRFNFVHVESRSSGKDEPVTVEEVRRCLKDIWGLEPAFDHLLWASRYSDAMRCADRFHVGRTFLVGESARIHYPASGVGMNFCLQDAFNLGWKLGRVVTGQSPESILDTYEVERRPVVERLLESVRAQCAVQFDFSREGIAFRRMFERDLLPSPDLNRELGLQLNGVSQPYPTAADEHPASGRPLPSLRLQTPKHSIWVPELLRDGTFLLLDLTGDDQFSEIDVPGVSVHSGVLPEVPKQLRDVTALLVRPDGYIHWVSTNTPPGADEARQRISEWVEDA